MVQGMQDIYDQLQQVFAEGVYEGGDNYRNAEKNTTAEGGVKNQARPSMKNPSQLDPRTITREDVRKLLEDVKLGKYDENTYIPVRISTPGIVQERLFAENLPMAMPVKKVLQAFKPDKGRASGKNTRGHNLTVDDLLYIIEHLDSPDFLFSQTNGRGVAVLKLNRSMNNTAIIVEFGDNINAPHMNGYEAGRYNISVTAFDIDDGDIGLFMYQMDKGWRKVFDKQKEGDPAKKFQATRPFTIEQETLNKSIPITSDSVKEKDSTKIDGIKQSVRKGETAEKALSHFGRTFSWKETGYLLIDGAKLDFSGRHEGASGGYRSVDHREILDVYPEDTELDGNGAMVDFMSQGNIRIMPEGNGINLQVQSTKAQEQALSDFISRARGEVTLDIDDANGNTVVSVEYPKGTYYSKVLQDIRNYFTDGTEPVVSELAKYRFSGRKGEKNTTDKGGVKFSTKTPDVLSNKTITVLMSDSERAQILQGKHLIAPIYKGQADALIKEEEYNLRSDQDKLVKAALVRIGEEFNVFVDYDIKDIDVNITLSRGNLRESVSKKASSSQIAKLLPVLKNAVENAIGVESHKNRYFYDNTTISFDNLIGGYVEGEYFVPVRFGLKHIRGGEVTLYVVIDQQKIKAEVLKPITQNDGSTGSRSACSINIAQIIPFVNSKDLLRYLPDDMLSSEQKEIKWEGIAETIIYTNNKNDQKYKKFIDAGNMQAAKMMVDAAAKAAGYTIKAYHGTTNRQEKSRWNPNTRSWDTEYQRITVFKRQYPEQAGHFFNSDMDNAGGYGSDLFSVFLMLKKPLVIDCKGQNYASITYNGMEMDTYEWAAYAKKQRYDGVIFENISDGVGYDDLSKLTTDYVVFDSNRIKSADAIEYDNDNNVIPISQRFDPRKNDIRFSARKGENDAAQAVLEQENARL